MDISVIIPTYKPKDYLWKCLDSLYSQTLDKLRFEIVIVLNGCNEPYREQIESYIKKHTSEKGLAVTLIQTDAPGVSNARNLALDVCKGNYVCFIDDDDWVSDNYLENLLRESRGNDAIVVANELHYHEDNNTYTDCNLGRNYKKLSASGKKITLVGARPYMSTACLKIIPKAMIGDTRFDLHLKLGEDALFMATVSRYIHEIRLASADTLYYRRLRKDSATTRQHHLIPLIENTFYQYYKYTTTYFSAPLQYDFSLFFNRILAVTKRFFLLLIGKP